ncbi:uncharacterized protein EV422DRAFT_431253 [Fimicolochytrium jonesii]|uniref:uncharacterized protein n=1 Tax=Fimicolochytrium jonesii TaxID=1396493 RepID=UPI0022FE2680|nr:uncharacterized protein EV422DRAFT_431253 [Fimicolochytrium jonesii]KAI8821778.1 hypothetical protein EV422DRAFT_431253 [Fimicolochytrium jonesii]
MAQFTLPPEIILFIFDEVDHSTAKRMVEVCREWHGILLRPLYQDILLKNPARFLGLFTTLTQFPERRNWIVSLVLETLPGPEEGPVLWGYSDTALATAVLRMCGPQLEFVKLKLENKKLDVPEDEDIQEDERETHEQRFRIYWDARTGLLQLKLGDTNGNPYLISLALDMMFLVSGDIRDLEIISTQWPEVGEFNFPTLPPMPRLERLLTMYSNALPVFARIKDDVCPLLREVVVFGDWQDNAETPWTLPSSIQRLQMLASDWPPYFPPWTRRDANRLLRYFWQDSVIRRQEEDRREPFLLEALEKYNGGGRLEIICLKNQLTSPEFMKMKGIIESTGKFDRVEFVKLDKTNELEERANREEMGDIDFD